MVSMLSPILITMIIFGGLKIGECILMNENESEITEEDLRVLCQLHLLNKLCYEHAVEKRKSAYMRFGRSYHALPRTDLSAMAKRKSAYMRFGKRLSNYNNEEIHDQVKRKSAYMR
ncbi:unnamed protein product [Thelazia callipaeda]|uniref:Uncharacterized protein n=1 Tax=Thelazia callipaeda TaxID=103827 RepID=A0A0N5CZX6_THECL|nr:unnamed protein product [Thelazia callipaeda]